MKKNIVTLFVLFLTCICYSQKGFHIGIAGTFSSTWILNQNNYGTLAPFANTTVRASEMNYKAVWGGNGGLVFGYNLFKFFGVQAEIQYNVTGQKYEDNFTGPAVLPDTTVGSTTQRVNVKRQIKLSYIQIPIMAKVMVGKKRVKFYAMFGPQFGFRTSAWEQVQIAGYTFLPDSLNFPAKDKFKSVDIGLALQFGTDIFITKHLYLNIGISAYGGLNDLNGKVLQNLDWYSKNDVKYQKSYNFRGGICAGIHYIIGRGLD